MVAMSHSFYPRGPVVLGEMLLLLSLFFHCLYYHVARIELDCQNQSYLLLCLD
jgi:hypothetical protein